MYFCAKIETATRKFSSTCLMHHSRINSCSTDPTDGNAYTKAEFIDFYGAGEVSCIYIHMLMFET